MKNIVRKGIGCLLGILCYIVNPVSGLDAPDDQEQRLAQERKAERERKWQEAEKSAHLLIKHCDDNSFLARIGSSILTIDPNTIEAKLNNNVIRMDPPAPDYRAGDTEVPYDYIANINDESLSIKLYYYAGNTESPYWKIELKEGKNNALTACWYPSGILVVCGSRYDNHCAFKSRSVHFCNQRNYLKNVTVHADYYVANLSKFVSEESCKIISPTIFNLAYLGDFDYVNLRKDHQDEYNRIKSAFTTSTSFSFGTFIARNFELLKYNTPLAPGLYNLGVICMRKNNAFIEDLPVNLINGRSEFRDVTLIGNHRIVQLGDSANKNVIRAAENRYESQKIKSALKVKIDKIDGTTGIFSDIPVSKEDFDENSNQISIKDYNDALLNPLSKVTDELRAPNVPSRWNTNINTIKERYRNILFSNEEPNAELISNCRLYNSDGSSLLKKEHIKENKTFKFKLDVGGIKDIATINGIINNDQSLTLRENKQELSGLIYEICKRQIERILNDKESWQGLHREEDWREFTLQGDQKVNVTDIYRHLFGANVENAEELADNYFKDRAELKLKLGKVVTLKDDDNPSFVPLTKSETLQNEFQTRIYADLGNDNIVYVTTVHCSILPDNTVDICEYKAGVPLTLAGTKLIVQQLNEIRQQLGTVDNQEDDDNETQRDTLDLLYHGSDNSDAIEKQRTIPLYKSLTKKVGFYGATEKLSKSDIESNEFKIGLYSGSYGVLDIVNCSVQNSDILKIQKAEKRLTPKAAQSVLTQLNDIWQEGGGEAHHFKNIVVDPIPVWFDQHFVSGGDIPISEIYEVAKKRRVYATVLVQSSEKNSGQILWKRIPVWFLVTSATRNNRHSCIFFDVNDRPLPRDLNGKLSSLLGIYWADNKEPSDKGLEQNQEDSKDLSNEEKSQQNQDDNNDLQDAHSDEPAAPNQDNSAQKNNVLEKAKAINQINNGTYTLNGNTYGMF